MKQYFLIVLAIIIFGYILRIWYLPNGALTFGYDQARDAVNAQQIINGDLKIQGPPASTPGMHHGVLWYYFLVIPNLVSNGNPVYSAYWNALFNVTTVLTVYLLTLYMFSNKKAAILSAILYAVSYEATQYATWLSNPTLGAFTVPLIYLGLWIWITRTYNIRLVAPILTGIALGFSVQANVFLVFHLLPVLIWILLSKTRVRLTEFGIFTIGILLATFPMIISEFKFGLRGLFGILSLISRQDTIIASKRFGDLILLFLNQTGEVYAYNSIPHNIGYGGVLVYILIIVSLLSWYRKYSAKKNYSTLVSWEPFLTTWILASMSVVSVGGASTPFLLVGVGPAVSVLLGIYLHKWWSGGYKTWAVFIFTILLFSNVSMIIRNNTKGQTRFAIQKDMLLSKQLEILDYTYNETNGDPFIINALTSPLDTNIVWAYIYKWYGQSKYGYTPSWNGPSQIGQVVALDEGENADLHYLIIEPMDGIPQQYLPLKIGEEDVSSTVVDEKKFGSIMVQKRIRYE